MNVNVVCARSRSDGRVVKARPALKARAPRFFLVAAKSIYSLIPFSQGRGLNNRMRAFCIFAALWEAALRNGPLFSKGDGGSLAGSKMMSLAWISNQISTHPAGRLSELLPDQWITARRVIPAS